MSVPCPMQVEWEEFDALRQRAEREWNALPPTAEVSGLGMVPSCQRMWIGVHQVHACD